MLDELAHFRRALLRVVIFFFLLALLMFGAPLAQKEVAGATLLVPQAEGKTVATFVLERMTTRLVPEGVEVVALNPFDPFVAHVTLAVLLAFILSFPLLMFEAWRFVAPGLFPHERRALGWFSVAAVCLLILGAAFGYFLLIPAIFSALYAFGLSGAPLFFSLRELVSLSAGLVFVTSFIFLLPVGMVLLAHAGLVTPHFWRAYARHAVLLALVASAIITPDGSGVSMILLSIPICGLYAAGYAGSLLFYRGREIISESYT